MKNCIRYIIYIILLKIYTIFYYFRRFSLLLQISKVVKNDKIISCHKILYFMTSYLYISNINVIFYIKDDIYIVEMHYRY